MFEFRFPDVAEGIHEGKLIEWRVKEGDSVTSDEKLCDMETDKSVFELSSPKAGKIVKLHFKSGDTVKVGSVLVTIDDGEMNNSPAAVPADKAKKKEPVSATQRVVPEQIATSQGILNILPRERKLAMELGVDLTGVKGTGPGGRITREDIEAASKGVVKPKQVAGEKPATVASVPEQAVNLKTTASPSVRKMAREFGVSVEQVNNRLTINDIKTGGGNMAEPVQNSSQNEGTRIKFEGVREKIKQRMEDSWHNIPHAAVAFDINVDALVASREKAKEKFKDVKLTYLAYIAKALAMALEKYPMFNSKIENNEIVMKNQINVGIAVDTEQGLVVPNIKDANKKSILDIARDIQTLADKARNRKLSPLDITNGSVSITNVGSFGAVGGAAMINYPEVSVLMVSKIIDRVEMDNGKPVVRKILPLTLAFDHRVVDGADAGRILQFISEQLNSPGEVK
jgi:pyruvate dehydrogenase E2 component (dihydrolipoamide acetyltransferase)